MVHDLAPFCFYLWGEERAQREDPTLQCGDESEALPALAKIYKFNKSIIFLITCTAH